MKKAVLFLGILLLGMQVSSYAQVRVQNAEITNPKGKRYAGRFQRALGKQPTSFLIKASNEDGTGIGDYLLHTYKTLESAYLHVYFGRQESGDTLLVMTGAILAPGDDGQPGLEHDKARSALWMTRTRAAHTVVPYNKEYKFEYCDLAENCDITDCNDGVVDENMAKKHIAAYQMNTGENSCSSVVAESFLLPANAIRAYLRRFEDVEYLQFYIGYKDPGKQDKVSVMVVGVDKVGRFLWDFNEEHYNSLYTDLATCPKCNVDDDRSIDHHRQDGKRAKQTLQKEP